MGTSRAVGAQGSWRRAAPAACDSVVGLYYYRHRVYHSQLGRFVTRDPVGYEGGVNLYAYVWDSPIDSIDPMGLQEPVGIQQWLPEHLWSDWAGRQLLFWWLYGGGEDRFIFDDAKWSTYMKQSESLRQTVRSEMLSRAIELCRNHADGSNVHVDWRFPAKIGFGESVTGYAYLHGANPNFRILGRARLRRYSGEFDEPCCDVTFDVRYYWRDEMNPEKEDFDTDRGKAIIGEIISAGYATDYDTVISWKGDLTISLHPGGIQPCDDWPFKREWKPRYSLPGTDLTDPVWDFAPF